jgi:hypothetical protein
MKLSLLWQIPYFHFVQVEQLITHLIQSGSTCCGIIGAMFYGFLIPSILTNVMEELTIVADK